MSEMFDKKAAEQKYLHSATYHTLVDVLTSMLYSDDLTPGDAFSAVEFACRRADEVRLKELGGPR